ncbi:MAG TPA: hypothetical protein VN408_17820 [Actinoplanes sp.]|nr:hypothetical protein [Actinoplanes sp.]
MTETGWPLIPREVLPPPVPVAKRAAQRATGPVETPPGRQLSMFSAETTEPSPADVAGLLAGPGRLDRMGGTARVSIRVDSAWRVHVLVSELVMRGLTATWEPVEELSGQDQDDSVRPDEPPVENESNDTSEPKRTVFEVRTAYSRRLNGLALAWPDASAQLFLSGPRLRLWVAAAGSPRPGGHQLGLNPEADRSAIEGALVRAGLSGRVSDDGRHYLISGRRRLRRLAELVGDRPPAAPEEFWPGGVDA